MDIDKLILSSGKRFYVNRIINFLENFFNFKIKKKIVKKNINFNLVGSNKFAKKLLNLGIKTPEPIAYFEFKNSFFLKSSFYVSKQLDYDFTIREVIKDGNFNNRLQILKMFSRFTYKLHENNINYLDHSPGNTLIKFNNNECDFYLIDLNRMQFKKMSFEDRMQNFNRLTKDPSVIEVFSREYATLFNQNYDLVYNKMLSYSERFFSNREKIKKQDLQNFTT